MYFNGTMHPDLLKYIIENRKWPFLWSEVIDRYLIMIIPVVFVAAAFGILFSRTFIHFDRAIFWGLFFSGLYLFYLFNKRIYQEAQFYNFLSKSCKKEILESCYQQLGWEILYSGKKYLVGRTEASWTSWGELVTIVYLNDEMLFNSRPISQALTWNREKVNLQKLSQLLFLKEQEIHQEGN